MPELPEVERGRRIAERAVVGRMIRRVKCAEDRIVFDGFAPSTVQRKLTGRRVEAVHRRGKQLWFELDEGPHPLFHFGMTGAFRVPHAQDLQLVTGPKVNPKEAWPPRFTKIHLWMDDGSELVMTNARRLGRIKLRRDPLGEPPIADLGFDPLLEMPTQKHFAERLAKRTGCMKNVLMDQSFSAGVGNWIADEILYQSRVDPRRRASTLSADEVEAVRKAMRTIVKKAVSVDAVKADFPRKWLFHDRWGKNAQARTHAGEPIEFLTVGGRTTAWVPSRQR